MTNPYQPPKPTPRDGYSRRVVWWQVAISVVIFTSIGTVLFEAYSHDERAPRTRHDEPPYEFDTNDDLRKVLGQ